MRNHYEAFAARLNADVALAGKGHDTSFTDVDGAPVRSTYWLLFGGAPDVLDDGRMTALQLATSDAEFVYTVRSVSTTGDGARSVQAKVAAQMIGHPLVVPGRLCRTQMTDATDIRWDQTAKLFHGDQEFTVFSSRA